MIGRNPKPMAKPFINENIVDMKILKKMDEHTIDLRKETTVAANTIIPMDEDIQTPAVEKKINYRKKRIEIVIDMELADGSEDFLETTKLNMITNINNVIAGMTYHTKDTRGYTVNRIKANTQINTK